MNDAADLLAGKSAIVTGAGRGLGREYALALAGAGAAVLVNDIGPTDDTVAMIRARGGTAVGNGDSVASFDGAKAIVDAALSAFGRLDVLVNNAGLMRAGLIGRMAPADWDASIAVNLTGTVALCHWAAAHWLSQPVEPGRAIVNVSSPAGTFPLPGGPGYVASKAGVAAVSIAMAQELAPLGVRVNALAPMARTEMMHDGPAEILDMMRAPESGFDQHLPAHVAPVVAYLASPLCKFTGRVIGAEGDLVVLFDAYDAACERRNAQQQWTPAGLAEALADVPAQQECHALFPGARVAMRSPPDGTLAELAAANA